MTDLVTVAKNGETMRIHPNALEEHKKLGWTVFEVPPAPVPVVSIAPPPPEPVTKPQLSLPSKGK